MPHQDLVKLGSPVATGASAGECLEMAHIDTLTTRVMDAVNDLTTDVTVQISVSEPSNPVNHPANPANPENPVEQPDNPVITQQPVPRIELGYLGTYERPEEEKPPVVYGKIMGRTARIMLDSGCSTYVLDPDFANASGTPCFPCKPIPVELAVRNASRFTLDT
jgi:hypothetical protein